jgi:hypothetical protein
VHQIFHLVGDDTVFIAPCPAIASDRDAHITPPRPSLEGERPESGLHLANYRDAKRARQRKKEVERRLREKREREEQLNVD